MVRDILSKGSKTKNRSKRSLPREGWVDDPADPSQKGKWLCFPHVMIAGHPRGGNIPSVELRLVVHTPLIGPLKVQDTERDKLLDMTALSEYPSTIDVLPGDKIDSERQPSLCHPLHHDQTRNCPQAILVQKIMQRFTRWGSDIEPRGDIRYLNGFLDWSSDISHKLQSQKSTASLGEAIFVASKEYSRPNGMYRALCEFWYPETNTFVTGRGEIGISLWEMQKISGLSITDEYYEEVVPSFDELMGCNGVPGLPLSCQYLFKAYALLVSEKESDCVSHSEWLDFWYTKAERISNPRLTVEYKERVKSFYFDRTGRQHPRTKLRRPFSSRVTLAKGGRKEGENPFVRLDFPVNQNVENEAMIAAYLSLWLCRFVLPCEGGDVLRPGTFKVAALMARGTTFSLVPLLLCCLYKGLTQTYWGMKTQKVVGASTSYCPLHYLFGWVGLHFPRGVFGDLDADLGPPYLIRTAGVSNSYFYWEDSAKDARDLIIIMNSSDFKWHPEEVWPPKGHRRLRTDDGDDPSEIQAFMISCRPGFVVFRYGNICEVEMYSPHRFARQHGFRQRIPGTPIPFTRSVDMIELHSLWLSLTQTKSRVKFFIPPRVQDMSQQFDKSYRDWWVQDVVPHLDALNFRLLEDSVSVPNFNFDEKKGVKDREAYRALLATQKSSRKRGIEHTRIDEAPNVVAEPSLKLRFKKILSTPVTTQTEQASILGVDVEQSIHKLNPVASLKSVVQTEPNDTRATPNRQEAEAENDVSSMRGSSTDMPSTAYMFAREGFVDLPAFSGMGDVCNVSHLSRGLSKLVAIKDLSKSDGDEVSSCPRQSLRGTPSTATTHTDRVTSTLPTSNRLVDSSVIIPKQRGMLTVSTQTRQASLHDSDIDLCVQKALHKARDEFIRSRIELMLNIGFSNLREWQSLHMPAIVSSLKDVFRTDPMPFANFFESLIVGVEAYLLRREKALSSLSADDRDLQLSVLDQEAQLKRQSVDSLRVQLTEVKEKRVELTKRAVELEIELTQIRELLPQVIVSEESFSSQVQEEGEALLTVEAECTRLSNAPTIDDDEVAACEAERESLKKKFWNLTSLY